MFMERRTDWGLIAGGIVLICIGLVCMFYPGLTLAVISIITGVGFLIAGCVSLAAFLRTRGVLQVSGWALLYAILDIVVGIMFIFHPVALAVVIPWVCGAFVLAFGIFEVIGAVRLRGTGIQIWGWMMASGVISVLLGICFFISPGTLSLLIGIFALMQGISSVVYGISVGRLDVL